MAKLYIMGCGGFGTALAVMFSNVGHDVTLWGWMKSENDELRKHRENIPLLKGVHIPDDVKIVDDIDGIEEADVVFIATPSIGVRGAAERLKGRLSPDTVVACVSKGFEPKTLKPLFKVIEEELPNQPVVVLSGPSHAEEVSKGVPTTIVAAGECVLHAQKVQDLTANTHVRIYTSDDRLGVQLGGALKNVIAFSAGILDGMGMGDNTKAALMTRGLTEIARLAEAMGARPETLWGLAGMGDLIVTCCSLPSRNRRCGVYVGEGLSVDEAVKKVGMTVEGITATVCAYELAQKYDVDMPITTQIYRAIQGECTARDALKVLLARPLKHESESSWLLGK